MIGTWAGPRSAGTALRHAAPPLDQTGGQAGRVGLPARRHGRGDRGPWPAPARAFGARDPHRGRGGPHRRPRRPGRRASRWPTAPSCARRHSGHHRPPADLVPGPGRPRASCRPTSWPTSRRWQSRSGTVKVNFAVDRLPMFAGHPEFDPQVYGGTIVLAESLDDIETSLPGGGRRAGRHPPVRRHLHPERLRPDAGARGQARGQRVHPVGAAHLGRRAPTRTSWPRYADRVTARMEAVAPGFTDSVLGRQVIGPHADADRVRAGRRQHLPRRADAGADVPLPPGRRVRRPAHPGPRALPGRQRHPRRRRGHRHPRSQRGPPGPAGPAAGSPAPGDLPYGGTRLAR